MTECVTNKNVISDFKDCDNVSRFIFNDELILRSLGISDASHHAAPYPSMEVDQHNASHPPTPFIKCPKRRGLQKVSQRKVPTIFSDTM